MILSPWMMTTSTHPAQPEALLSWMHSLSDPTRLRLLSLLEAHELGVVELCEVLQLPQSTVSRHLKVLGERGWIHARPQGTANFYRMYTAELDANAAKLWELAHAQTEQWAQLEHDRLRLAETRSRRGDGSFFARTAERWEALRHDLYGSAFLLEALAAMLPPQLDVLDLGCGTGELLSTVAPRVRSVVGVDNSREMLDAADRRIRGLELPPQRARLLRADLDRIPLADDCCDAATMLLVLSYVDAPTRVLAELSRLLRPGGRGVVVTLLRHDREDFRREMHQLWPGFEPAELTRLARDAGLVVETCHPLKPDPRAKGPALLFALLRGAESSHPD
jgi:ubiquinone/menaquinone biosynthesis C-methylase UbiE/DNA-binding MarR family transcriptional regulator